MPKKSIFKILYAPNVKNNLRIIDPQYYSLIRKAIIEQLERNPEEETRNRKPLLRPIDLGAKWELRFGPGNRFRVFYMVDNSTQEVWILGIGVKIGEKLIFGEKEE